MVGIRIGGCIRTSIPACSLVVGTRECKGLMRKFQIDFLALGLHCSCGWRRESRCRNYWESQCGFFHAFEENESESTPFRS